MNHIRILVDQVAKQNPDLIPWIKAARPFLNPEVRRLVPRNPGAGNHQPRQQQAETPKPQAMSRAEALGILDLPGSATKAEIHAKYKALAQQYHPDKVGGLAPGFQKFADEQMKRINAAHQFLTKGAKS